MAIRFRVQSVRIEGFKGFTIPKEIDFRGRHVFLLGMNGNGKSSIIEAIRWGLFGSTRRPNEIVKNRDYSGRCRVDISLNDEGKQWNFRRTLNLGTTGGSDAVLTDDHGREQPIQDVMPQLDSVDAAGEGMHIIFAPQATPLRRQPENLDAFERTVFNHLGLSHPRALLDQLETVRSDQEWVEKSLGERITDARYKVDSELQGLERQRGAILGSPPWDSTRSPSVAESENKARELITEITGEEPDESLSGLSLDALIDAAEEVLTGRHARDLEEIDAEATAVDTRKKSLGTILKIQEEIGTQKSAKQQVQEQLSTILQKESLDELRKRVDETRATANVMSLRRQLVELAITLLNREEAKSVSCPVCEANHSRHRLETILQGTLDEVSNPMILDLGPLEAQLQQTEKLDRELRRLTEEIGAMELNASAARNKLDPADGKELPDELTGYDLATAMEFLNNREASINAQIGDQDDWFKGKRTQLSKLKEEERFHQLNRRLTDLKRSKNRFGRVEAAYQDFVAFGESVRTITQAIGTCLNERLEADLPGVSENLSQAFAALTKHPRYDRLTIAKDMLPRLQIRVASSHDPSGSEHPTDVLNGQSESALALVPYFAFSQVDDAPTEVYLVLLDDPTRAFDEEHIKILVERLAELGRNVQLVIASQETDRFRRLLPEKFQPESYIIVEPTNWSYQDGPALVTE